MSVLSALRPLPVARLVHRDSELPPHAAAYERHRITLAWEERLKARSRRISERGFEFGTALPRGTVLRDGDCLLFDEPRVVVVVCEREEPVFIITPRTTAEWSLFAYHIGNNHQPMMIARDAIVCPEVPGMEDLLKFHDISFVRAIRPFTPVGQLADHRHD